MSEPAPAKSAAVYFPPDPNPKKPKLKMPPGAWDTHFHVMGPPHLFPFTQTKFRIPPAAPVEHYLMIAKVLGFERGVTVTSSSYGTSYEVTLNAIKVSEGRLRGMIRADAAFTDADLKKLHAQGVRGIRIELREGGGAGEVPFDPREQGSHFEGKELEKVVAQAARLNWPVALHIGPDVLIRSADLLRKLPAQIIIENYAAMDARLGPDQPALKTLVQFAQETHIWLKTASAYRMMMRGGDVRAGPAHRQGRPRRLSRSRHLGNRLAPSWHFQAGPDA
jgi:2-pyrone-4,6-dicarboxylate lactonase